MVLMKTIISSSCDPHVKDVMCYSCGGSKAEPFEGVEGCLSLVAIFSWTFGDFSWSGQKVERRALLGTSGVVIALGRLWSNLLRLVAEPRWSEQGYPW